MNWMISTIHIAENAYQLKQEQFKETLRKNRLGETGKYDSLQWKLASAFHKPKANLAFLYSCK